MTYRTFRIPVELRFRDLDAYGHVNHAEFFTFIETARVKLMEHELEQRIGPGAPLFVVVEASCRYKEFITLRRDVVIVIQVEQMKRASFDLLYTITDGAERVFAVARTTMVCLDSDTQRPTPIPERFLELLCEKEAQK
ncbi:MAG: acyl-CoA thioesterase [Spirochaeta sp.]|nr:acyl-CoA thioesterase [Spirochaeta sp.]